MDFPAGVGLLCRGVEVASVPERGRLWVAAVPWLWSVLPPLRPVEDAGTWPMCEQAGEAAHRWDPQMLKENGEEEP